MTEFKFDEWASNFKLKESTQEKLKEKDFNEEDSLLLMTHTDIEQMEITLGQRRLLEKAIQTLQGPPKPIPTQLAKNRESNHIIAVERIGANAT